MNNKTYNGPQSDLMGILMEKTRQHGEIDCVSQVYLARGCLSVEKEFSMLKWGTIYLTPSPKCIMLLV